MNTLSIDTLVAAGLSAPDAQALLARVSAALAGGDIAAAWRVVSREVLTPAHPHTVHRLVHETVFATWDDALGPRPAWIPTEEENSRTHIGEACRRLSLPNYAALHAWSVAERAAFWEDTLATLEIRLRTPATAVADLSHGLEHPEWLPGARMNIAESCFSAPHDAIAVIYQREGGAIERVTYGELDALSNRFANGLLEWDVHPGEAIAIAMPMTLQAVVAYLGIVKAGAVVVSIADSFAPEEIATRMRIANATLAVTQDVVLRAGKTLPMYEKVVAAGAEACIVAYAGVEATPLRDGDMSFQTFLSDDTAFTPHAADPLATTNVLFSSGTTGEPKAIPWSHTTPIKCAMDGYYHHDIHAADVVAWPTNLGWMMGPWLIYASLVNRATLAMCYAAANTPAFCKFVEEARVTLLGVVPSLVKAWRAGDMAAGCDWSGLRAFSSTGEASNADDYFWLMARAGYKPVIEYCGGTEIGGGYITQTLVQAASPAVFSTLALGIDAVILDEDGAPVPNGEMFLVPPSIGCSLSLLNRDHHDVYYADTPRGPGGELLRRHGDQMEELPAGYYRAHGRADDTMNLGGIKVSSAEIERAVMSLPEISDAAAIALNPAGGGPSLLVLCVVLRGGVASAPELLKKSTQDVISRSLNPLFRVHEVRVVEALPRTASNKVMRRVLRDQFRA